MTTGALIYAFNNEQVDYLALASWAADNIRRHLSIPVAVVTDATTHTVLSNFDHVISAMPVTGGQRNFDDLQSPVSWHNGTRPYAYDHSPWDRTLLVDADYIVASSVLDPVIKSDIPIIAHKCAADITGQDTFDKVNTFGAFNMPMWWATVVVFDKSVESRLVFESMKIVQNNWSHYLRLYNIDSSVYRNDYALSIALEIVNGHTQTAPAIAWPLLSAVPTTKVTQVDVDRYRLDFTNTQGRSEWIQVDGIDFHCMGKRHLGEIVANSNA